MTRPTCRRCEGPVKRAGNLCKKCFDATRQKMPIGSNQYRMKELTCSKQANPCYVYLRALSKVRNAQALTDAEEYAYSHFTPADVIANSMLPALAGFLQETGLSEDMQDQAFAAGAESLKCPDCKSSLTFVGDGVFCRCNDHELQTAGRVETVRALASVEPPALTTEDVQRGELLAAKWAGGVIVAAVVAGVVWCHGLGAWVTGLFGK